MSRWKIIFLGVLGVIDAIILAVTIGYLVMAIKTPDSLGGRNLFFTGSYILFACYFLVFAIITTIGIVCFLKWRNKKNKTTD